MPARTVGAERTATEVARTATEVARTTTEETRAVFAGLPSGSDHTVEVTATPAHRRPGRPCRLWPSWG
ncbi:hypothetical protein ACLGI4_00885 [Streptomyces sp. HMX112]|uniref:hypothetical protein n=1 Tax=Streptomyces sp. HMX112 TaxID=3390850 RepID=UPI003A80E627